MPNHLPTMHRTAQNQVAGTPAVVRPVGTCEGPPEV